MKNNYIIDVPPPTISGDLHMGHVFSYIQMDFLARWHEKSKKLMYPFCFDNNGLPTELLGIKNGLRNSNDIQNYSLEKSLNYKKLFEDIEIGYSEDNYSTFDDISKQVCFLSFEDLLKKKLIYKSETEYYFCPS